MEIIFISYRRGDSAGHTGRLFDALERRLGSERVFRDVEDLEPGVDFPDALNRALANCRVMLVMIGRTWASSGGEHGRRLKEPGDLVRTEVATALARKGVQIIPVLVDGASMPGQDELPEDIQALGRKNAMELSDTRWDYDVNRLGDVLVKHLGLSEATAPGTPRARGKNRKWAGWLIGISAVLLASVALWVYFGPPSIQQLEPQQAAKRYLNHIDEGDFEGVYRNLISDAIKPTMSRETALATLSHMRSSRAGDMLERTLIIDEPKRRYDMITGRFMFVRFQSVYTGSSWCDDLWLREEPAGWKVYESRLWQKPAQGCSDAGDIVAASAVAEEFLLAVDAANIDAIYPAFLAIRFTEAYKKSDAESMLITMRGWTAGTVNSRSLQTSIPIGAFGAIPGDFAWVRFRTIGGIGIVFEDIWLERTDDMDWRVAGFVGSQANH